MTLIYRARLVCTETDQRRDAERVTARLVDGGDEVTLRLDPQEWGVENCDLPPLVVGRRYVVEVREA